MTQLRWLRLVLFVTFSLSPVCFGQQPNTSGNAAQPTQPPQMDVQTARDRSYAMDLYSQGKYVEAVPWLEKVVKNAPTDVEARERLGGCLLAQAANTTDPATRKSIRIRARKELLQAKQMGDTNGLLEVLLAGTPEDGSDPQFSPNAEVDRLIKVGEAEFGDGHYDAAKDAYIKAVILDPNNYEALLFVGDVYFAKKEAFAAGEWFSRAIEVDPSRETAYRYWGDTLMQRRQYSTAREKYIAAIVAEPYARPSWGGLSNFARLTNQSLTWYRIQSPDTFTHTKSGGDIKLNAESLQKKDSSTAWMSYPLTRALWTDEKFAKAYPNEKQYRHSLKEEYDALSAVAKSAEEFNSGKHPQPLSDDLQVIVKLYKSGLLEPYILLNGVDEGIAQDYIAYRTEHRDVLVRYLSEVVVPSSAGGRFNSRAIDAQLRGNVR